MLLKFSVENFRSIHNKCTLSMIAQGISDEPKYNYAVIGKKKILKTAAIYGANSSGKTNIIRALGAMTNTVLSSVKLNDGDKLEYDPFRLVADNNKPSYFEVMFTIEDTVYKYGFEIDSYKIHGEWLYQSTLNARSMKVLFIRTLEGIGVEANNFPEGIDKESMTNTNRLFISLCAQLGGNISQQIVSWFKEDLNAISGIYCQDYLGYSKIMLHKHLEGYDKAINFFKILKLGFNKIETIENEIDISSFPEDMPEEMKAQLIQAFKDKKKIDLKSQHNIYDRKGAIIKTDVFDIDDMESEGTKKLIQLSGPIFNTLTNGAILAIDELDAKMHPLISQYIVDLFNNPETNPNNAQLIFTTHDTHLLSSSLLRRDQIWFTEKDQMEQTDLYRMMDIELPDGTKPRNDANFEKNYIKGRYGAVPYIINN